MSPTQIGIDLTESPLSVGGLLQGRSIVVRGTKGLNLTGGSASATREEVVVTLEDARNVVKSFFGVPGFDAAVVVIPNTTSEQNKNNIISHGRGGGFKITQVIPVQVAIIAAYIDKVKPIDETTIAIISITGGIPEVSVITIKPEDVRNMDYLLILRAHRFHDDPINFEVSKEHAHSGDGGVFRLVGGVVKTLVVDPFQKAFDILKNILGDLDIGEAKVEKVVLVGKASTSEKVRQATKERFVGAEVWEGLENPNEVAAHGAAFLSYADKKLKFYPHGSAADIPPEKDFYQRPNTIFFPPS